MDRVMLSDAAATHYPASSVRRNFRFMAAPVRRIAVLGRGQARHQMVAELKARHGSYQVIDVPMETPAALDELIQRAQARGIDEVLVAAGSLNDVSLGPAIERLAACPVDISVDLGGIAHAAAELAYCPGQDKHRRPRIILIRQPMQGWHARLKRSVDVVLSCLALLFLAPLLCLVALAIRLESPGPVIFRQTRNGLDQRNFRVWKFRTMRMDDDPNRAASAQATRIDPRVTRIGRFLRRSSIDELPQLINVLRGDMSLVGPRPHPVPLDARFAPMLKLYAARHRVLPGITGLAQIHGCRGETDTLEKMAQRLRYDLEYIRSWSPWLDLKIILATLCGRFTHPNAY